MIKTKQELKITWLEDIRAGVIIDVRRADGSWECTVIDLDGEIANCGKP